MNKIECEMCGGNDLIKQDGVYVCQRCGTKYSVEEARKLMIEGTVNVRVENEDFVIRAGTLTEYRGQSTDVVIPDTVKVIGRGAFRSKYISSVVIPDSVTSIGEEAFRYCYILTSITIPNSVTSIEEDAFRDCTRLTSVHISDLEAWCKIKFNYSNPLCWAHHLYLNGKEIKELVIPNGVTSIGRDAFRVCKGLTSVTIPDSVTSIGEWAFCGCTGLTSITIPDSVTSIGDNAFYDCTGLTSITIGSGVTSIGDSAFHGCKGLTSITIPNSVTSIGRSAFSGCRGLTSVTIGSSVTSIGSGAFTFTGLTRVIIPQGASFVSRYTKEDESDGSFDSNVEIIRQTSKSNKSSGCYIATCVYGSYDCPDVWTLRRFRDDTLAQTWYGRLFIRTYYAVSPTLVKWFGHTEWFKKMWKPKLDRLVEKLKSQGVEDTPYKDREW